MTDGPRSRQMILSGGWILGTRAQADRYQGHVAPM